MLRKSCVFLLALVSLPASAFAWNSRGSILNVKPSAISGQCQYRLHLKSFVASQHYRHDYIINFAASQKEVTGTAQSLHLTALVPFEDLTASGIAAVSSDRCAFAPVTIDLAATSNSVPGTAFGTAITAYCKDSGQTWPVKLSLDALGSGYLESQC